MEEHHPERECHAKETKAQKLLNDATDILAAPPFSQLPADEVYKLMKAQRFAAANQADQLDDQCYAKLRCEAMVVCVGEVFTEFGFKLDISSKAEELDVTRWQLMVQDPEAVKLYDSEMDVRMHPTRMVKLRSDTSFSAKVRLWSEKGKTWGPWSPREKFRTLREVRVTPNDIGEDYIRLTWDRPQHMPAPRSAVAAENDAPPRLAQLLSITGFQIRVLDETTMNVEFEQEFEVGVRSYTLYGLAPAGKYIVFARYINLIGSQKNWAEQFRFVTEAALELGVSVHGENFLTVAWQRAGLPVLRPSSSQPSSAHGPRPSSASRHKAANGPDRPASRQGGGSPEGLWDTEAVTRYEVNTGKVLQYQICIKGGGRLGVEEDPILIPATETQHTLEDLIPGTTYELAVRSLDEAGRWGLWSPLQVVQTVPQICIAVEGLGETFTTFTWQRGASADSPPEPDSTYRVHVLGVGHPYEFEATISAEGAMPQRMCRLEDLKPGLQYKVFVRGYLADHWGLWSEGLLLQACPLMQPECKSHGEDFIEAVWRDAPTTSDSMRPIKFQVQVAVVESRDHEGPPVQDQEVDGHKALLTGLVPDVRYRIRVRGLFPDLHFQTWGCWSAPLEVATIRAVGLQMNDIGEDFALLNWTREAVAIEGAGPSQVQDFKYELVMANETTGEQALVHKELLETSYRVEQLQPGATYSFAVRACDEQESWGLWQKAYFQTLGPITVTAHEIGEEFVRLIWQRRDVGRCAGIPASANILVGEQFVHRYRVQVTTATAGGDDAEVVRDVEVDPCNTAYRLDGLAPDMLYNVRVRASTGAGAWGLWSDQVCFRTVKAFSVPLTNLLVGENYIKVDWEQQRQRPEGGVLLGDDTITSQQVRVRGLHVDTVKELTLAADARSVKIPGLQPATAYGLSIRKCTGNGEWGPWMAEIPLLTAAAIQINSAEIAEDYVVLEWFAPAPQNPEGYHMGTGVVTTYQLRVGGDDGYSDDVYLQEGASPHVVTGLRPDHVYEFAVRGHYNDDEWGPWSGVLHVLTLPRLQVRCELISEAFATFAWSRPASENKRFVRLQKESQDPEMQVERKLQRGASRPVYEVRITTRASPPDADVPGLYALHPANVEDAPDDEEVDDNNAHGGVAPDVVVRKRVENHSGEPTETLEGLHPNTIYTVSVRSGVKPGVWGMWSTWQEFITLGPILPCFDAIGEGYTSLRWERAPPPDGLAGHIARGTGEIYQSEIRVVDVAQPAKPGTVLEIASGLAHTITDLQPFRNYEIAVRCHHDGAAWGVWGGGHRVRTQTGIGITVEHVGEDFVDIVWCRRPDAADPFQTPGTFLASDRDFERYAVKITGKDGFLFQGEYDATEDADQSFNFKGLLPDTMYEIAVSTKDSFGNWGFWSAERFLTANRMHLSFGNIGEQFAVVRWSRLEPVAETLGRDSPYHQGRDAIQQIRLKVQEAGREHTTIYEIPMADEYHIPDLKPDTLYYISLAASTGSGCWGMWCEPKKLRTLPALTLSIVDIGEPYVTVGWVREGWPPASPGLDTSVPDPAAGRIAAEEPAVEADARAEAHYSRGSVAAYQVRVTRADGVAVVEETLGADAAQATLAGLDADCHYRVSVRGQDLFGEWGLWSAEHHFLTLQPVVVDVREIGEDSVDVVWRRAPAGAPAPPADGDEEEAAQPVVVTGDEQVQRWKVRVYGHRVAGAGTHFELEFDAGTTSHNISGLVPNATYTVSAMALSASGEWGFWSTPSEVKTLQLLQMEVLYLGEDFAQLQWHRPLETIVAPEMSAFHEVPLEYHLRVTDVDDSSAGACQEWETAEHRYDVTGLAPGRQYKVEVRQRSREAAWGQWSSRTHVYTLDPVVVTMARIGEDNVTPCWARAASRVAPMPELVVSNACVTQYQLAVEELDAQGLPVGGTEKRFRLNHYFEANLSMFDVMGLRPNTIYGVQVRAQTGGEHWGLWSQATRVATMRQMEVTVELINEHNLSVSWARDKPHWLRDAAEGEGLPCPADPEEICVGDYRLQNVQLLVEGVGDGFKSLQVFPAETTTTTVYGLQPDCLYCVTVRSQNLEDIWSLWSQKLAVATLKEVAVDFGKTAEDFSWLRWARPVQEGAAFADPLGRLYRAHYDAKPQVYDAESSWLDPTAVVTGAGRVTAWHVRVWGDVGAPTVQDMGLLLKPDDGDTEPPPATQVPGQTLLLDAKFASATQFKLCSLAPDHLYTVTLRARNCAGVWGAWVAPRAVRTLKPLQLNHAGFGENFVKLYWYRDAPDTDPAHGEGHDEEALGKLRQKGRGGVYVHEGTPIESYVMSVTLADGGSKEIRLNASDMPATRYTLEGLGSDLQYCVQLCVCYGDEEMGPWCEVPLHFVTMNLLDLAVTYIGEDFISVQWHRKPNTPPSDPNVIRKPSGEGQGHEYQLSLVTEDGSGLATDQPLRELTIAHDTDFRVGDLQPDTLYCIAIREHHSDARQWGAWCGKLRCQTMARMATSILDIQETAVKLRWDRLPAFQVEADVALVKKEAAVTSYQFRVRELREVLRGQRQTPEEAEVQLVRRAGDRPGEGYQVEPASLGNGDITWPPHDAAPTTAEDEGKLEYDDSQELYQCDLQLSADQVEMQVEGLQPNKFYSLQVRTETTGGEWGLWSFDCYVLTMDTIKVTVPLIAEDRLTLQWARPAPRLHHGLRHVHVADLSLQEYQLSVEGVGHSLKLLQNFQPDTTIFSLEKLNHDQVHAIAVRSKDTWGRWSLWSPRIEVVTPKSLRLWPGKVTEHFLEAHWAREPQDPTEYPHTPGVPLLFSGNLIAEYRLQARQVANNTEILDIVLSGTQKSLVLNALQPNTQYSFIIQARVDGAEWGLWAKPTNMTTMPRLDLCVDTVGENYMRLKWWRDMPDIYELMEKERATERVQQGVVPEEVTLPRVYCTPDTKIDHYEVLVDNPEGSWVARIPNSGGGAGNVSEYVVPRLLPNTRYMIAVRPCYGDGDWGLWSHSVASGTLNVLQVDVASAGEDYLSVSWQRAANTFSHANLEPGDPEVTVQYQMRVYDVTPDRPEHARKPPSPRHLLGGADSAEPGALVQELFTTDTKHVIENLEPNRKYSLLVRHWYVPQVDPESVAAPLPEELASRSATPRSGEGAGERWMSSMEPGATHGVWSSETTCVTLKPMTIQLQEFGEDFLQISWSRDAEAFDYEPEPHVAVVQSYELHIHEMDRDGTARSDAPDAFTLDRTFPADVCKLKVLDLKPDTVYTVQARACAGKDNRWGKWSPPVKVLTLAMLETHVDQLGETYGRVRWGRTVRDLSAQGVLSTPRDTVVKYHLEVVGLGHSFRMEKKFKPSHTNCMVRGLEANKPYKLQVRSYHEDGVWSLWSKRLEFVTLKPMTLKFDKVAEQFMQVSWGREGQAREEYKDMVPEPLDGLLLGDPAVSKYHLCVYQAKRMQDDAMVDVQFGQEVNSYEIRDLNPDTPYLFLTRSANPAGEWGVWSPEVVVRTMALLNITIASIGENYMSFSWTREGEDRNVEVHQYQVKLTGANDWLYNSVFSPSEIDANGRITVRGLAPDSMYEVSLCAAYGEGEWGLWSHAQTFATLNRIGLGVTHGGLKDVECSWKRLPQADHQEANPEVQMWQEPQPQTFKLVVALTEPPVEPYIAVDEEGEPLAPEPTEFYMEQEFEADKPETAEAPTTYVVENLPLASVYEARVCAKDSTGEWGEWQTVTFRTPPYPPGRPVMRQFEKGTVGFSWDAPDSATKYDYTVEVGTVVPPKANAKAKGKKASRSEAIPSREGRPDENVAWKAQEVTAENAASTKTTQPLAKLRFRVKCAHAGGDPPLWSGWSHIATFTDMAPPDPPVQITVTQLTKNFAAVEWAKPLNAKNHPKLIYKVFLAEGDGALQIKGLTKNNQFELQGLTPQTLYRLSVHSESENGASQRNPILRFTTKTEGGEGGHSGELAGSDDPVLPKIPSPPSGKGAGGKTSRRPSGKNSPSRRGSTASRSASRAPSRGSQNPSRSRRSSAGLDSRASSTPRSPAPPKSTTPKSGGTTPTPRPPSDPRSMQRPAIGVIPVTPTTPGSKPGSAGLRAPPLQPRPPAGDSGGASRPAPGTESQVPTLPQLGSSTGAAGMSQNSADYDIIQVDKSGGL